MSGLLVEGLVAGRGKNFRLPPLDLSVAPGEVVALIGPNGAGKTTLLKTMAGLLPPLAGSVARPATAEDVIRAAAARASSRSGRAGRPSDRACSSPSDRISSRKPSQINRPAPTTTGITAPIASPPVARVKEPSSQ